MGRVGTSSPLSLRAKVITGLALTLSLVFAGSPAWAAGSFTFDASFKVSLASRKWYQNAGSTTISANLACGAYSQNSGVTNYNVTLYRDVAFDESYGKVSYACGGSRSYTWKNLPKGYYYFVMSKGNDGETFTGRGKVTYP